MEPSLCSKANWPPADPEGVIPMNPRGLKARMLSEEEAGMKTRGIPKQMAIAELEGYE